MFGICLVHVRPMVQCEGWAYVMPVCVLFVSYTEYRIQPEHQCNHCPQPISEGYRPIF